MLRECYQILWLTKSLNKSVTIVKIFQIKYLILCTVALLFANATFAQSDISEIFNPIEKKLIGQDVSFKGNASIELFLASGMGRQPEKLKLAIDSYANTIEILKSNFPVGKKETRQVDYIYRGLRKAMFKEYAYIAELSQTFESGIFNCVGSTALVALTLDHFGFQFEIQRLPNHVFLYAKADGKWLRIETTSLDIGVVRENRESQSEIFGIGNRRLHKNEAETISLRELAGWQYYNNGLLSLDRENYTLAFHDFYKAHLLNESAEILEMLKLSKDKLLGEAKSALNSQDFESAFEKLNLPMQVLPSSREANLCLSASILGKVELMPDLEEATSFLIKMQADFPEAMAFSQAKASLADRLLILAARRSNGDNDYLNQFVILAESGDCPFDLAIAEQTYSNLIADSKTKNDLERAKELALQFGKLKLQRIRLANNQSQFAAQ